MVDVIDVLSDRRADADASEIGLRPGMFPHELQRREFVYRLAYPRYSDEGELIAVYYMAESSIGPIQLVVWND